MQHKMKIIYGTDLDASGWRDSEDWADGLVIRKTVKGEFQLVGDHCNVADRVPPIPLLAVEIDTAEVEADRLWLMHPYGDTALGYVIVDQEDRVEHVYWDEREEDGATLA